jgi:AcrR family transcriptional regulator
MASVIPIHRKRMTLHDRREQIVREAMALFARHGFAGTTTQEIARRAGISEALLFRVFKDKKSLYSAIIDHKIAETGEELFPHEAASRERDEEVFGTIAGVLMRAMERDPSFVRLLLYSGLERHQLAEMFYEARIAKLFSFLERYIRRRIRRKAFRPVRADLIARAFVGMVSNHMLNREILECGRNIRVNGREAVNAFVDLTLRGLRR